MVTEAGGKSMYQYRRIRINRTKAKDEHRLIMEQLLGRELSFHEVVHHKNGDCKCNDIDNLVLMTRSEHARHHRQGKKLPVNYNWAGKARPDQAKLTYSDVQKVLQLKSQGLSNRRIAKRFGVDHTTIDRLLNGKTITYNQMLAKA